MEKNIKEKHKKVISKGKIEKSDIVNHIWKGKVYQPLLDKVQNNRLQG